MAIEIARGCTEGCRFCQAGMIYRPVRERDPEEIVDTIVNATKKGGYDEVGLTTLSTADYSCISPLIKKVMEKLRPEMTSLSVASLRAYGLDEDLLDEIRSVRATGLTFAPEAGTQRMRDVVNKNVTEEDLIRTAHRVLSRGWRRMKLYFMIGLPTETDEDVAGIMETGRRMKSIGAEYHPRGAVGITVSVSSHVPKPHTPFQWCAMDSLDEIERKQDVLRDLARKYRLEFRRHDPRTSYLECVLGRGDRRMANVIEDAWREGARFDSWNDQLRWGAWLEAMDRHEEIPYDLYLGTLPTDARLPWDHLDMQLEPRFLATEYRRAMRNKLSPPCGKPAGAVVHHANLQEHEEDERILVCYHCGVECDMARMREERGEFLSKLRAFEPAATLAAPLAVETVELTREEKAASGAPRVGNGKPPHDFHQGEPRRFRVRFAKQGVAALTGHLDLVRTLPRIMRRAGLRPYYSQGFHPKPVMEFSPPLPLGVSSTDEYVDLSLVQELTAQELLQRLENHAPQGLAFLDAERLEPGSPKLSRVLAGAEYVVRVEEGHRRKLGHGDRALDHMPAAFLSRAEAAMDVVRKRKPKRVDIRPAVETLRWISGRDLPPGLGIAREGARYLLVRLLLDSEAHTRPEEVAAFMLGEDPGVESVHITRTQLLRREGEAWAPLLGRGNRRPATVS
jgi:radical SAM-linked protein